MIFVFFFSDLVIALMIIMYASVQMKYALLFWTLATLIVLFILMGTVSMRFLPYTSF